MRSPYPPAPELMGGLPTLTPFIHQWEFLLSSYHDAQFVSSGAHEKQRVGACNSYAID